MDEPESKLEQLTRLRDELNEIEQDIDAQDDRVEDLEYEVLEATRQLENMVRTRDSLLEEIDDLEYAVDEEPFLEVSVYGGD